MSTEVSIKQAADLLAISEQRVRTLCRDGVLRSRRVGNIWLVDSSSLSEFQTIRANRIAQDHPIYKVKRTAKPIALSFFSGAMGLDQGIEQAGFDILLACEVDKCCRQTIKINKPNMALIGDINQYASDDILAYAGISRADDIDLIFGGPPCQAFSTAGKRGGFEDKRGNVFLEFLEKALNLRPKILVIENVRGLLSCPIAHRPHNLRGSGFPDLSLDELPGGALNLVLNIIQKHGYMYSFNLYNTANFGTPQVRERVVIVCVRDAEKKPPLLKPTHAENGSYGLMPWVSFRQATQNILQHHYINFPEKRLGYYKQLKEGQNWRSLPEDLQKQALGKAFYAGGGKSGFLRRLAWDKPAPTLVTHPAMPATDLAHPEQDRPLSIEEYKRIQQFSDDWLIAGPLLEQYKQVGNAVPVGFGKAIGDLAIKILNNQPVVLPENFRFSRYKNTSDVEWLEEFNRAAMKKSFVQQLLF